MNVFVLCTGRCGSMTFVKACRHITNFTSAHESRVGRLGDDRLDYPDNHIEADNRLSWLLGRLDRHYGDDAMYVHLTRDEKAVAQSYARRYRWKSSIIDAYRRVVLGLSDAIPPLSASLDYCDTVNTNITFFLKDKTNTMPFRLENAKTDFRLFWERIGAQGDLDAALAEFDRSYNSTEENAQKRHELAVMQYGDRKVYFLSQDTSRVKALFEQKRYAVPCIDNPACVVDIGANSGLYGMFVHFTFPRCRIHLFEPHPVNAKLLHTNADGIRGVTIHDVAVSDFNGEAPLYIHARDSAGHTLCKDLAVQNTADYPGDSVSVHVVDAGERITEIVDTHGEIDILRINQRGTEETLLHSIAASGALAHIHALLVEYADAASQNGVNDILQRHAFEHMETISWSADHGMMRFCRS